MPARLGSPLPTVKSVPAPSEDEINLFIAKWNTNAPAYYRGLLEADASTNKKSTARFLYDQKKLKYIHRASGRVLTRKEISQAFIEFSNRMAAK